jgi:hypothetical protein
VVRRASRALIVVVTLSALFPSTWADAAPCTAAHIVAGTCAVGGGTTGGGVDLWGDATSGGNAGDSGSDGPRECPVVVNGQCVGTSPPKDGTGPTTVRDIESFRPRAPIQFSEPAEWSVRHIPTNFWASTSQHVVRGELLGNPAEVRFTPVLFRRYFGDGDRRTTATVGASWRELGQSPWTRTATSHNYESTGRFRIRMLAWFEAEYRFGHQSWMPLEGAVTAWSNELTVTVLASDTVLVDRPCGDDSVGCR